MRILYVEDSLLDADLVRIKLTKALPEARLTLVQQLGEALTELKQPERFDVVVSDLALPDGSGLDLVLNVRGQNLPLALVILTGSGDERSAVAALKSGADDYLIKQGDYLDQLPDVIESAVASFQRDLARRSRPLRVLYAEHHAPDIELTCRHLKRHAGHIVMHCVADASSARQALAKQPEAYDVLLLDYRLAGMNALELLRELKAGAEPTLPVVLVTGQGDQATAVQALRLGVMDYLVKRPGYLHELPSTLENAYSRALLEREEGALRISEAARQLREEALEALPQGVFLKDEAYRIIYTNPAFTQLTGYTAEESIGCQCDILEGPETCSETVAQIRVALEAGKPFEGLLLNYRKDGTPFWNQLSLTPVRDAAGKVINIVGVHQDVTERRHTEEALRASEERFRQIAENIHEVFWMTDPKQRTMLYISPAYEEIWGRPRADVLANPMDWLKGIHPDDRARIREVSRRMVDGGYHEIYRVVRPDGSVRWIRDRSYPIRNAAGQVYRLVGTAEDITEQRQLESQLVQAQKMEAIGTLAGGIAHDFNNILAAIIGYTELINLQVGELPTVHPYLAALRQAGTRATSLVRQILAFSRQEDHERHLVHLGEMVKEPLELLRTTTPSTIAFELAVQPTLPPVLADPTQIHQVLMNLGTNAAHAMKDAGGTLSVRLDETDVTAEMAVCSTNKLHPGPHIKLVVSDTGRGIPPETLTRIFEPFFTTKAPGEGTGLGLSMVHGIMQAHGGGLTVESTPGQGTTFHLYFPVHPEPPITEDAVNVAEKLPRGRGERILIIDDESSVTHIGRLVLNELGYEAEGFSDVLAGLARIRANPTAFDLVITDLAMPGQTGVELAHTLRQIRPDLPIIITTGYNPTLTQEKVHELGINELVLKPFTMSSLAQAVRRTLDVMNNN